MERKRLFCKGMRIHHQQQTAQAPLRIEVFLLTGARNPVLIRRRYPKGVKITDERMQALSVTKDQTLPKWNYTIRPS